MLATQLGSSSLSPSDSLSATVTSCCSGVVSASCSAGVLSGGMGAGVVSATVGAGVGVGTSFLLAADDEPLVASAPSDAAVLGLGWGSFGRACVLRTAAMRSCPGVLAALAGGGGGGAVIDVLTGRARAEVHRVGGPSDRGAGGWNWSE